MAVIKWTALVTGMKGVLRGSVLQFGAGGQIIRSNKTRNKANNPRWQNAKLNTANNVYGWRTLSPSDVSAWAAATVNYPTTDRYGGVHYPSPYTLYMRLNNCLLSNLGSTLTTPASPWSFSNLGTIAASADYTIPQVLIMTTGTYATGEVLQVSATAGLSQGRKPPAGLYKVIGVYDNVGSYSQDVTTEYLAAYGGFTALIAIFFKVKLLSKATGQLTPPYVTSAFT